MARTISDAPPVVTSPSRASAASCFSASAAGVPTCSTSSSAAGGSVCADDRGSSYADTRPQAPASSVDSRTVAAEGFLSSSFYTRELKEGLLSKSVYPCHLKETPNAAGNANVPALAEDANVPALLIVCLSPELLRGPSYDTVQNRQKAQRPPQSSSQPAGPRAPSHVLQSEATRVNVLQSRHNRQDATPTRVQGAAGSYALLPADSAGYIFLAEQFLPSLGVPLSVCDSKAGGQEGDDASCSPWVNVGSSDQKQSCEKFSAREVEFRRAEVAKMRQNQHWQTQSQPGSQCRAADGGEHAQQARLQQLPSGCLLRTKYYEAPLRIYYQFLNSATSERDVSTCGGNNAASYVGDVCACTGNSAASSGECAPWHYSGDGSLLHLATPPEAVLLLCSSLGDLYRAHELVDSGAQDGSLYNLRSSRSLSKEIAAAEAAAANGDTLPVPRLLRRSPYVLCRGEKRAILRAGDAAAPRCGVELSMQFGAVNNSVARELRKGASGKAEGLHRLPGGEQEVSQMTGEGEMTGENWLASIPVKLLVCFDAEEDDTDASSEKITSATPSSSAFTSSQMRATADDNSEDPSVILFFENSCFLEKLSVSLPTRSLRCGTLAASSTPSTIATGGAEAAAGAPAACQTLSARESKDGETVEETGLVSTASSCCTVRPLLGAPAPLLGSNGNCSSSSMRALQRLVEALHCHMWPSMRLLKSSSISGRYRGEDITSRAGEQYGNAGTLQHSSNHERARGIIRCPPNQTEDSPIKECWSAELRTSPTLPRTAAEGGAAAASRVAAMAADCDIMTATAGAENEAAGAAYVGTTGGEPAVVVKSAPAAGPAPPAAEMEAASPAAPATENEGAGAAYVGTTDGGPAVVVENGPTASTAGNGKPGGDKGRKCRATTSGDVPLQVWESLARTVREMRLEAHTLPHAERTARAEALALQLAEALGVSDEEEGDD